MEQGNILMAYMSTNPDHVQCISQVLMTCKQRHASIFHCNWCTSKKATVGSRGISLTQDCLRIEAKYASKHHPMPNLTSSRICSMLASARIFSVGVPHAEIDAPFNNAVGQLR